MGTHLHVPSRPSTRLYSKLHASQSEVTTTVRSNHAHIHSWKQAARARKVATVLSRNMINPFESKHVLYINVLKCSCQPLVFISINVSTIGEVAFLVT